MLKRTLTALLGAVLILTGLTGPSTAAADVPGLRISAIGYNAYGSDVAANRNSEYVEIVNDTTPAASVKVAGLLLQDAWAKGRDKSSGCNTYTLAAGVLPIAADGVADELPAGAVLRIHLGSGTAGIDRAGVRHVYVNMSTRCGYNGHIFNNGPSGSNRWAAWDTAWISLGGVSESRGYNFSFGYVAK